MSLNRYDRYDGLLTAICFIISLSLYMRTLTPGLLHGDSGEFQTLAYLLGHTHPTGYPVYLVLAKLATILPLGDVAYRVNLFAALMAALTVAGVYLSGRLLVNFRVLALIGAIALAISPTYLADDVDGIADSVTAYVANNLDEHPIFFSEREPSLLDAGFKFVPAQSGPVRLVRILDDN